MSVNYTICKNWYFTKETLVSKNAQSQEFEDENSQYLPDENSAQTEDRTCCIKLGNESERKRPFIAKIARNFTKKNKKLICTS